MKLGFPPSRALDALGKNILLNYFVNNNDIDNDLDNKRDGCGIEEMKNDDTGDELNGAKNEKKLKNFRI